MIFGTFGTPTNAVIRKYLNAQKVPHLFPTGGADQWNDPKGAPWTFGWQPNYNTEMHIYAEFVLAERPQGKIGILYQNDDVGKDNLRGLREGLGDKAARMIVKEASYETTDATVDSQIISLREAGADVFFNAAAGKFAAQAIRKAADLQWKPLQIRTIPARSRRCSRPRGSPIRRTSCPPSSRRTPTIRAGTRTRATWTGWPGWTSTTPRATRRISSTSTATCRQTLVEVLKRCGATSAARRYATPPKPRGVESMLMPGITLNTSATQHADPPAVPDPLRRQLLAGPRRGQGSAA